MKIRYNLNINKKMKVLSLIVVLAIVSCGQSHQVFTKEELAKFDGSDVGEFLIIHICF